MRLGGGDDFERLGHAADAGFAALGHLAGIRPDDANAVGASCARLRCVALAAHMCGFIAGASRIGLSVASSTAVARSSAWPPAIFAIRSAVAGATTMRSVSRARRIWPTSNSLCAIEQVGEGALAGERAGRERRDEMLRRRREDAAHARAALLQPADQVERFVGGDAAADDEQDALSLRPRRCALAASPAAPADLADRSGRALRGRLPSAACRRMMRTSSSIERPWRPRAAAAASSACRRAGGRSGWPSAAPHSATSYHL